MLTVKAVLNLLCCDNIHMVFISSDISWINKPKEQFFHTVNIRLVEIIIWIIIHS
jgi:hypothetical protein